jgi:hypothetical protein
LFIVRLYEEDPKQFTFLLKIKNKLEIGNANIAVNLFPDKNYKELILSYKSIYINSYMVTVIDISDLSTDNSTIFRHESFQLWESDITGLLISNNKDFVILNRDGLSVMPLGKVDKRIFQGNEHQEKMVHCLE